MPSRRTLDSGAAMAFRVSTAFSARYSWTKPRIPLRSTMAMMTMAS